MRSQVKHTRSSYKKKIVKIVFFFYTRKENQGRMKFQPLGGDEESIGEKKVEVVTRSI